jgi:hypothetical protein
MELVDGARSQDVIHIKSELAMTMFIKWLIVGFSRIDLGLTLTIHLAMLE